MIDKHTHNYLVYQRQFEQLFIFLTFFNSEEFLENLEEMFLSATCIVIDIAVYIDLFKDFLYEMLIIFCLCATYFYLPVVFMKRINLIKQYLNLIKIKPY